MSALLEEEKSLLEAAKSGDLAEVQRRLDNGVDVNCHDQDGLTPLHWALKHGHDEISDTLLENGANSNTTEADTGETTLHHASREGREDAVHMLLENGANVAATDKRGATPLHLAARHDSVEVVQLLLDHGADTSIQDENGRTCLELALENKQYQVAVVLIASGMTVTNIQFKDKLVLEWVAPFLTHDVALKLLKLDFPVERNDLGVVSTRDSHSFSWTTFLDSHVPVDSAVRVSVVSTLLSNGDDAWIRELATAKDQHGREALQTTDAATRDFLNGLRYFCGRYEIFDGPPIHVSSTAVVVNAYDHGVFKNEFDQNANKHGELDKDGFAHCGYMLNQHPSSAKNKKKKRFTAAEFDLLDKDQSGQLSASEYLRYCDQTFGGKFIVAMKFMRNKDEHAREIHIRRYRLNDLFVLGLLPALPQETFHANVGALELHGGITMKDYPNVLVMPAADRRLEDIFLNERPNNNQLRDMLHEVAQALQNLHENGLVHGDLKMSNVLRVDKHLRLIGMGAATRIGMPIGAKFSSGILPPEMFHKLKGKSDVAAIAAHWQDHVQANPDLWTKVQPRAGYCVKTFHEKAESKLPFKPVKASPALDVWAFGVLMYQMHSGAELVPTDMNQDVYELYIARAATWTDEKLAKRVVNKISNKVARRLISQLLKVNPDDRISIREALAHPYFQSDEWLARMAEKFDEMSRGNTIVPESVPYVPKVVLSTAVEQAEVGDKAVGQEALFARLVQGQSNRDQVESDSLVYMLKSIQANPSQFDQQYDLPNSVFPYLESFSQSAPRGAASQAHLSSVNYDEIVKAVGQSKEYLMRGIFEATEVAFPTSFVFLPVDLTKPLHDDPKYVLRYTASFVQRGLQLADYFMDAVKDNTVVSRALHLVRPGAPLFLYLIDEVNGVPVIPDAESSLYPIRIDTKTDEYTTFMSAALPYLESGCKMLKGANTIAAFASILRVTSLGREAMDEMVDQIEDAKKKSSVFDFDVVQSALRGAALRELERFFNKHDAERDYSGLCRTYALNGQALWTTKDTIEEIDHGRSKRTPALKPKDTTIKKGRGKTAQEIYIDLLLQNHVEAPPPAPSMP